MFLCHELLIFKVKVRNLTKIYKERLQLVMKAFKLLYHIFDLKGNPLMLYVFIESTRSLLKNMCS